MKSEDAELPSLDAWGRRLSASTRPSGIRRLPWMRRLAVPLIALTIGAAGAAGIAAAADAGPFDDELSATVAPDAGMPVPVLEGADAPSYDCEAYQRWGREVYIPWWNAQIAETGTVDIDSVPVLPRDICE